MKKLHLDIVPDGPAEDRLLLLVLLHGVDQAVSKPELVVEQDCNVWVEVGHDTEALVVPAELLDQQLPPEGLLLVLQGLQPFRFSQGPLKKQFCLWIHLKRNYLRSWKDVEIIIRLPPPPQRNFSSAWVLFALAATSSSRPARWGGSSWGRGGWGRCWSSRRRRPAATQELPMSRRPPCLSACRGSSSAGTCRSWTPRR